MYDEEETIAEKKHGTEGWMGIKDKRINVSRQRNVSFAIEYYLGRLIY